MNKTFYPISVSSKFAICGLPLRVDTYKTCSFGCKYCFSNCRKIMEFEKTLQVGNIPWLEKKLNKIFIDKIVNEQSFMDMLINEKITWHCGGMSDPFQPSERRFHITEDMINLCNKFGIDILFSTKSDNVYSCNISPDHHSFQLSITNLNDRIDIEPNVPSINSRILFFKYLKRNGFKVGIRVQPFIPNITSDEIVDVFKEADYFTIEGIKAIPQNEDNKNFIFDYLGLGKENFTQMGLLNLKPEIRIKAYESFVKKLSDYSIPYSISDNDLHYISSGKCCCGDPLIKKSTTFNNTALIKKYGMDYSLDAVITECGKFTGCIAKNLFTSNRTEGCSTVCDFYKKRFDRKSSPFSPKFQYIK